MKIAKGPKPAGNEYSGAKSGLSLGAYNKLLIFSCLIGLGLSLYSYTVELILQQNQNYRPLCDINDHMSCTKGYQSPYGKGFGLFPKESIFYKPNSFFGIVFYSMVATLSLSNSPVAVNVSLLLVVLSNFTSLYLAYMFYFTLKALCLVCIGLYVVNVINLVLITKKHKKVRLIKELIENYEKQKADLSKKDN